jgi:hypothetical protein
MNAAGQSPERRHARTEQNVETQLPQLSSSTSSPSAKSPDEITNQGGFRRALESWLPQSAGQFPSIQHLDTARPRATPPRERDQHVLPPEPRLLAMSPRRLGHSSIFDRSPIGNSIRQSIETDSYAGTAFTSDAQGQPAEEEPVEEDANTAGPPTLTLDSVFSPLQLGSPELPPPFSRTVRVHSAAYTAPEVSGTHKTMLVAVRTDSHVQVDRRWRQPTVLRGVYLWSSP